MSSSVSSVSSASSLPVGHQMERFFLSRIDVFDSIFMCNRYCTGRQPVYAHAHSLWWQHDTPTENLQSKKREKENGILEIELILGFCVFVVVVVASPTYSRLCVRLTAYAIWDNTTGVRCPYLLPLLLASNFMCALYSMCRVGSVCEFTVLYLHFAFQMSNRVDFVPNLIEIHPNPFLGTEKKNNRNAHISFS